eukprot:763559-Hanusia_phi.AAC.1
MSLPAHAMSVLSVPPGSTSSPPSRRRAHIDPCIAREIFLYRLSYPPSSLWHPTAASILLARQYGITPKAVRDIWTRRTWAHATSSLGLPNAQTQGAAQAREGTENVAEGQHELPRQERTHNEDGWLVSSERIGMFLMEDSEELEG